MKTEATEAQVIAVMAACFAVSNLGLWQFIREDSVRRMVMTNNHMISARYAVCELAGHLMEEEEHEDLFSQEAEGWERDITKEGLRVYITRFEKYPNNGWLSIFRDAIPW